MSHRRSLVGLAIMVASVALFFWWGVHFKVFGRRIVFDLPELGFSAWLTIGMFGVGYAVGGWRSSLKSAGGFVVLMVAVIGLGMLLGNYR